MIDSFYIAWKYLFFSKIRFATLVACITLIAILPLALEIILDESERQLVERAEHTPLLVGARGSALDLVMNSLYFGDTVPELISMANLAQQEPSNSGAAARTIVIAVISNTMVKCGMTLWLGAPSMRRTMLPITGALALSGAAAAFLVG